MVKQPNRKLIGGFLIVGMCVFFAILGLLLRNRLFATSGNEVVMYFEESVNGLSVGAPVVFKGVKIGDVTKIAIKADTKDLTFSIPVYAIIHTKSLDSTQDYSSSREVLDALVARGLRARLASQSYVTGQLMVEMEMLPNTPVKYHEDGDNMEIPTVLSPLGELSKGLQNLPLAQGIKNFSEFFEGLNKSVPQINKIVTDIEVVVNKNRGASIEVLDNFNKATISINKAAKAVHNLADYLERHPEALIKGKK